jgi:hypothetical protein
LPTIVRPLIPGSVSSRLTEEGFTRAGVELGRQMFASVYVSGDDRTKDCSVPPAGVAAMPKKHAGMQCIGSPSERV